MNQDVKDVLASVSSGGRYTGHTEAVYQLGVLASWVARLAKTDWSVRSELEARTKKVKVKK